MTLQSTKSHLAQFLEDRDNKVVALSGKWGTGKSHLWREVKAVSKDPAVQNALYVSLFGLSDMNQIKLKIIQSALPNAEAHPAAWEKVGVVLGGVRKALTAFHKGFSVLDELALLAVPTILKDRVIVLDDIERKHEKLSIDEVLGFIDEFTQLHGARIVLILNSDQLADKSVWEKLREKVVDQEIRLDTSPAEAFEIAISLTPSIYREKIEKTVETCGLSNIRIIRKVIRAVNRILGNRAYLSPEVLGRVIPSTALLAAIYYKGIENGPDFDFVLQAGSPDYWLNWGAKQEELDEEGKRRVKWKLLLHELGLNAIDEFEILVVEYLQSGLFDVEAVKKIIDRYGAEAETMRIQHLARQLHEHVVWHYRLTDAELLAEARELTKEVYHLDAYNVTSLHELVSGLIGGQEVADTMVHNWISAFKSRSVQDFDGDNFFQRPIHPLIKVEFDTAKANAQAKTTVFDACEYVAKNSGWGHKQEAVMKAATVKDFEFSIKALDVGNLRLFMCRFLEMCVHRGTYEKHFGSAMDHFIAACRNICAAPQAGRLGKLIRLLFEDAKLSSALERTTELTPGHGE